MHVHTYKHTYCPEQTSGKVKNFKFYIFFLKKRLGIFFQDIENFIAHRTFLLKFKDIVMRFKKLKSIKMETAKSFLINKSHKLDYVSQVFLSIALCDPFYISLFRENLITKIDLNCHIYLWKYNMVIRKHLFSLEIYSS